MTSSVLALLEKLGGALGSPSILSAFRISLAGASLIPRELSSPVVVTFIVMRSMLMLSPWPLAASCWEGRTVEVVVGVVLGPELGLGLGGGAWSVDWSEDWLTLSCELSGTGRLGGFR